MTNQKLFEALERVCGFTALESDMFEIIRAVEADKMPMTETIEQAAERCYQEHIDQSNIPRENYEREIQDLMVCFADYWQSSQPNPHRIKEAHIFELEWLYYHDKITHSRMVEILNEIAEGKHKERIEI